MITKKEFSAVDAQPIILYAKQDGNSDKAFPVLATTGGSLLVNQSTGILDGRTIVTTAGTRVQLTTASTTCISVTITALSGNTGVICVGGITVVASLSTRTGVPLSTGDTAIIEIDNLNKIYLDTTVNGEGVSYLYKI